MTSRRPPHERACIYVGGGRGSSKASMICYRLGLTDWALTTGCESTGELVAAELDLLDRGVAFPTSSCIVGDADSLRRCFLVGLSWCTSTGASGPQSLLRPGLVMPTPAAFACDRRAGRSRHSQNRPVYAPEGMMCTSIVSVHRRSIQCEVIEFSAAPRQHNCHAHDMLPPLCNEKYTGYQMAFWDG